MNKCRLRLDLRFSKAQVIAMMELLAETFQYADAAGVEPDRRLMSVYDKLNYRLQQHEGREYVVRQLQAQNKASSEEQGLDRASLEKQSDSTSAALRHLQQRSKLGRKERDFYA